MSTTTVAITGATGGVGRALARAYASRGAQVGLIARGEAALAAAADDVEEAGGRALPVTTDVAEVAQVEGAAQAIEEELGPIDVWVNNAMVTVVARTWDVRAEEFRRVMEVNFLGYVHGTQAALRRMRPRNGGTVVQVGSALAFRGIPLQAPYCASKHAVVGFTESLRAELLAEHSAIDLCSVHLPGLNTTQFTWSRNRMRRRPQPVPPIFQPEVAADAIVWAADRGRRETYVASSTWLTIWGNRLAGGLLDHYLARTNVEAQLRDEPAAASEPDNLDQPVDQDEDHGARGTFNGQARRSSPAALVSRHRGKVAFAAAAAAVGITQGVRHRSND